MRKNKQKAMQTDIPLEDFATDNEAVAENFSVGSGLNFEDEATERDYFDEYYKAYKNDYIAQYLEAYKKLKESKAQKAKSDTSVDDVDISK
ncbi:hypothetical protein EOM82_05070 [bacterium]|nr:hypothetical protein [bacterium]